MGSSGEYKHMIIATTTLLLLINQMRPVKLKSDPFLEQLAMVRCTEMPDFSHDLYYKDFSKRIAKKYKYGGENLAIAFNDATSTVNAWNNSKSHKEIMTAKRYQKIGIATCEKSKDVILTVTLFGGGSFPQQNVVK